ncbi:MAG TPA: potassium channel family protein [Terriglobales bacterium]|jgi:hypothetical protein|nr:potassium channel family protein [Terriglobales bacterium]
MRIFLGILGFALIAIILGDAFETIILPRRVTRKFRLTGLFYRNTWLPWRWFAQHEIHSKKRRDSLLAFYGPLSLIMLLVIWAVALVLGFGFLHYAFGSAVHVFNDSRRSLALDIYFSGTTFFTLGLGDVQPDSTIARFFAVWEAGTGFGFLAIVIGYLPTIYQAFSRREIEIALLDARAGSPPSAAELIRRYAENRDIEEISVLLREWERWSADVLESHISYPPVVLFRSQHSNESWIGSLTAILDVCSLIIVGIEHIPTRQAQLTFAMARHAVVDLAQVLSTPPMRSYPDRLPPEKLAELRNFLRGFGARLHGGDGADQKLAELRHLYEPYVSAIANYLVLPVPDWFAIENAKDNWQTSAWEKTARKIRPTELDILDEHL